MARFIVKSSYFTKQSGGDRPYIQRTKSGIYETDDANRIKFLTGKGCQRVDPVEAEVVEPVVPVVPVEAEIIVPVVPAVVDAPIEDEFTAMGYKELQKKAKKLGLDKVNITKAELENFMREQLK